MKERLMVFGVGFLFSCLAIMFFLHLRSVRSGDASLIRRWVNAAGENGPIIEWHQADAFRVRLPKETITVQLNAVDAPGSDKTGGAEAMAFVQDLVGDRPVRVLEFRRNATGDVIGEVYTADNESLNESLMKAGWAWYYKPDSPNNPRYDELQSIAIAEKHGLWSLGTPEPPWLDEPRNTAK